MEKEGRVVGDKLMMLAVYFVQSTGFGHHYSGLQHEAPFIGRLPYGCFFSVTAFHWIGCNDWFI